MAAGATRTELPPAMPVRRRARSPCPPGTRRPPTGPRWRWLLLACRCRCRCRCCCCRRRRCQRLPHLSRRPRVLPPLLHRRRLPGHSPAVASRSRGRRRRRRRRRWPASRSAAAAGGVGGDSPLRRGGLQGWHGPTLADSGGAGGGVSVPAALLSVLFSPLLPSAPEAAARAAPAMAGGDGSLQTLGAAVEPPRRNAGRGARRPAPRRWSGDSGRRGQRRGCVVERRPARPWRQAGGGRRPWWRRRRAAALPFLSQTLMPPLGRLHRLLAEAGGAAPAAA
ncbi:hypothetical protein BU14_0068s0025 [Porphyra umbilicalis]|uniref:Uncharacterized protein n=1 Tax=Porphyra umbilicalis TaxID=2786 RepID=A0A1X6PGF4_PORUM|nr:hypothetical protein BU14_0068s0025 [Porphyra umbilicalis]|eukprot:OSX79930.1 hypothetical protein BU14_0068s0025 [Porphyra umbilicalis]